MDKLVAQYSRPAHQNEFYSEQEQQDLTASVPPLSLKFSMPPVDNVSCNPARRSILASVSDDNATDRDPFSAGHLPSRQHQLCGKGSFQQDRPTITMTNLKLMI